MPEFLRMLAETSNVRASCRAAGINRDTAYSARERDERFAADWRHALEDAHDTLGAVVHVRATSAEHADRLLWNLYVHQHKKLYGEFVTKHENKIENKIEYQQGELTDEKRAERLERLLALRDKKLAENGGSGGEN